MGRPFERELTFLPATASQVGAVPLEKLPQHVNDAVHGHVILVGAGGSLTAAEFCRILFDQRGVTSRAVTPQAFLESKANLQKVTVFIFTARGNNKDVLAVFLAAQCREAKKIVVVCNARRSKVATLAAKCNRAYLYSLPLATGRDGYLATNSLIATCLLLARAFGKDTLPTSEVEKWVLKGEKAFSPALARRTHLVILYAGWGMPAAVDLESKLSEAGIVATMLADCRHFAHGRHNWLDKQKKVTGIVAMAAQPASDLMEATLKHIPSEIPVWKCYAEASDARAALQLLLAGFGFVSAAGKKAGIDPGRPGVPAFGSKLYHLGPIGLEAGKASKPTLDHAAERKARSLNLNSVEPFLKAQVQTFVAALSSKKFGALVTDYDGTVLPLHDRGGGIPNPIAKHLAKLLANRIPIIFATGRGDSIHEPLKSAFSRKYWPMINIGYYNGSTILALADSDKFPSNIARNPLLDEAGHLLAKDPYFAGRVGVKNKGFQLSLTAQNHAGMNGMVMLLKEFIRANFGDALRIVVSSHSVDILPAEISKRNCLAFAQKLAGSLAVLSVGDCGAVDGNDNELLQHPYSLSVDEISPALDSCWNLLPAGLSHADGFLFYLGLFKIGRGHFQLKSPF